MIGTDIGQARSLLLAGEVVGVPTETVYGLAGNGYAPKTLAAIFEIKGRPHFDPLILHTGSLAQVYELVTYLPARAQALAEALWPGPLTLVLPRQPHIPDLVTAGLPTVAVRVPAHPLMQALLQSLPFPLAAPSANPFGYISPTTAAHVEAQLGHKIPYILDGGPCVLGLESTIIGFIEGKPILYRAGSLPLETLEAIAGPVQLPEKHNTTSQGATLAPGMLSHHYAPRTPLVVGKLEALLPLYRHMRLGILAFDKPVAGIPQAHQQLLSAQSDLTEAAHNLFAALRSLDAMGFEIILASEVPNWGLGRAINERLVRAAIKPCAPC